MKHPCVTGGLTTDTYLASLSGQWMRSRACQLKGHSQAVERKEEEEEEEEES